MRTPLEDADAGAVDHDHGHDHGHGQEPRQTPFPARRPGQGDGPVLAPSPDPGADPACSQARAHPGAACGCGRDHADPDWAGYGEDRDEAPAAPPPADLVFDRGPAEGESSSAARDPLAGSGIVDGAGTVAGAGTLDGAGVAIGARARNDGFAAVNRRMLRALGVLAVRLASAPGAGKSTLLARTVESLAAGAVSPSSASPTSASPTSASPGPPPAALR